MTSVFRLPFSIPIIVIVGFMGLPVSSCNAADGKLSRNEAKNLLIERTPAGSETKEFTPCPASDRAITKLSHKLMENNDHPCKQYDLSEPYKELFYQHYPILKGDFVRVRECQLSCWNATVYYFAGVYQDYVDAIDASDFVSTDVDGRTTVHIYDYKIGEVTGIRQTENTAGTPDTKCDALVDYTFERYNFAPWGEDYLTQIKKPKDQYSACFVKYDDGWRIKK